MVAYRTTLGHAHLKVRNLQRSIAFYTQCFDLHLTEQVGDQYAFLSGSAVHHELALQQVGPHAATPEPAGVGLYHIAFEVPDRRSFALAYRALSEAGVELATVDHGISWALYFSDPDGNGLEIYWDTRRESGGRELWLGQNMPIPEEAILSALEEE